MRALSPFRILVLTGLVLLTFAGLVTYASADPRAAPPADRKDPVARVREERTFTVPQEVADRVRQGPPAGRGRPYDRYVTVGHDSDKITFDAPADWDEIEYIPWVYQGREVGLAIIASSDVEAFMRQEAPGVFVGISHLLAETTGAQAVLDAEPQNLSRACNRGRRFTYDDAIYKGWYDHFACSGASSVITAVTMSPDGGFVVLVRVTLRTPAELDAAKRIFDTFQVIGDPAEDEHHDH